MEEPALYFFHSDRAKILLVLIITLVFAPAGQNASAAFVDRIESFEGSTKDDETWEEYTTYAQFLQDDMLFLRTQPESLGMSDYTTRTVTVGIGEAVSVEIHDCQISRVEYSNSICGLYLTDNSGGIQTRTGQDDDFIALVFSYYATSKESYFVLKYGGNGASIGKTINYNPQRPSSKNPYIFLIERIASNLVRGSVYNTIDMSLICSDTLYLIHPDYSPIKDELYISLVANVDTDWDNVTIIPEPASMVLLGLGGLIFSLRRRQR